MNVFSALRPSSCAWLMIIALCGLASHAHSQAPPPPDVRLVVDISGSMKRNDPANLRQPAVELLVQLLPKNSKSGVWTFGQYVTELVPHQDVDDAWKTSAAAQSDKINSVGLFTNIGLALEKAGYDVRDTDNKNASVILLTDGMVDISKDPEANEKEWRRIADEVIPKLQQAGVRVHTIALSENADSQLLNKLALATNGKAATAKTADELMKAFLDTFDQAAPAEQVPLAQDTFAIDSSVEEFTALIFRQEKIKPTELEGPDGALYSHELADGNPEVNWHSGLDYDLITLKQPLEGEWKVVTGIAPDSRVTVVSNLNLVVKPMPTNLFRGQRLPVNARLQEDGETVVAEDFLSLIDLTATTISEQERLVANLAEAGVPSNGVYRARLSHFNQVGEYDLTIALDGKSFQRQIRHSVTVRDAFSVDFGPGAQPGMPHELSVTPFIQTIDFKESSVIARIKTPSGQTSMLPVPATQVDDWLLKYSPQEDGLYEVSLSISVVETNGSSYDYQHPTFQFSYPEGDVIKAEEPVPEPEAEPEPAVEPEAEVEPESDKGIPWWVYVILGVANIVIFGLAFVAYRMVAGGKKDAADEEQPKKKSKKKEKEAKAEKDADSEPEPEPEPEDDPLAMADIDDGDIQSDESDSSGMDDAADLTEATDLSTDDDLISDEQAQPEAEEPQIDEPQNDEAEPTTLDEEETIPDAPMDDLEAMLAEATADLPELDDGDEEEFTLDDFDSDKK